MIEGGNKMKKITLLNLKGEKIKDIELNENIFNIEANDKVLKDAIVLTQASLRQGTRKVKNRSEVRGGGRKPWRQKGTGRARQGSIRSVQWRGGGIIMGPQPIVSTIKMNRKERRLALLSALTKKAADMVVVDELKVTTPKTKEMLNILNNLKLEGIKVLMVVKELEESLILASRNIDTLILIEASEINVLDLIAADKILITKDALEAIEEGLK